MNKDLASLVTTLQSINRPLEGAEMIAFLRDCEPSTSELSRLCAFNDKHYSRNYVDKNEYYELLVICWLTGQHSAIHDHGSSQCAVKVLEGSAQEVVFVSDSARKCTPVKTVLHPTGSVFLDSDSAIHQISNGEKSVTPLVTLHLYSPPLVMKNYSFKEESTEIVAPAESSEGAHDSPALQQR